MKRLRSRKRKRGRTGLSSSSLVESLAIRQRQPVHARKNHMSASSHPLAGLSSTLMTHRQSWSRINCLLRSRHRCGRRVRSEYGADLEISSSMIVSRVLLGSTVDQVSAASPALNLAWSMNMVLTVARRRRRSSGWSLPVRPVRDIWWSWLRWLGSHRERVGCRLGGMGCAVHV